MGSREKLLASLERLEPRLLLSTTSLSELFEAAEIIDVTPAGSVSVNGEMVSDGQTQMYQFSTPATGSFFIDMEALGGNLDSILEVYNEAGQAVLSYRVFRCWVSEYQALPELDANGNAVAIQMLKLENEGWERDLDVTEPEESTFTVPAG